MDHILYYILLTLAGGLPLLGMGMFLWSDYQNHKQSKKDDARKFREMELREEFINLYGGEEKFYHDMMKAYDMAREASLALSMHHCAKKEGFFRSADNYLREHREKADYYYENNPEFKLREYIQTHLNN